MTKTNAQTLLNLALAMTAMVCPAHTQTVTATIADSPAASLPTAYMGLSMEWRYAQTVMGDSTTGSDPIFRQLLKNLIEEPATPPEARHRTLVIRIGGGSTDLTSHNPALPTISTIQPFIDLYHALGIKFILGINAKANNIEISKTQAAFYSSHMPPGSLLGLEIGNEPELYGLPPEKWYPQLAQWIKALKSVSGKVKPIVNCLSPDCNYGKFPGSSAAILEASHEDIAMFTCHFYTGAGDRPSDWLLQERANAAGPNSLRNTLSRAHRLGIPFRVDEMNSLAQGGRAGVSDTFQSGLWVTQQLFHMASLGVDGVNIQGFWTPGREHYSPATIAVSPTGEYKLEQVYPIYYGLLLFQQATANGAQIYPVTLTPGEHIHAWATIDAAGVQRVTISNLDHTQKYTVKFSLPQVSSATVSYLRAPSYTSVTGVTLGGQTFDGSQDGRPRGNRSVTRVPGSSGTIPIEMPASSAALITFNR